MLKHKLMIYQVRLKAMGATEKVQEEYHRRLQEMLLLKRVLLNREDKVK